jgi:hypothetical protein
MENKASKMHHVKIPVKPDIMGLYRLFNDNSMINLANDFGKIRR